VKRPLFITFEGVEGCGKSTHAKLLAEYLEAKGHKCLLTREPGGTKLGEAVRNVLLGSKDLHISDISELFLFEACRSQIVKDIIHPALNENKTVICDRFSDATFAYQGFGGNVGLDIIETLDKIATGSLAPDVTILLDIDTVEGLKRAKKKGVDRMEAKDIEYHKRVRAGYIQLANRYPDRIRLVKVADRIEDTRDAVRKEIDDAIKGH
jgi:dTMP kinase